MGLDQLGLLTVGTITPKKGGHTLLSSPCSRLSPGLGSHRFSLAPQGKCTKACPMRHLVSEALTHAGNQKHRGAGNNQGSGRAPQASDVQVFGGPIPIKGGC